MKSMRIPKKRQDLPDLPPGLWVVATPIGNLSDISDRARRALEHADRVLCEDTRRTSQLLEALGLEKPLLERLDAYASSHKLTSVVEWLEAGENLALVTDAGTPAISDPGAHLVALAHERNVTVTPIPGPSAVTALLSVSGFGETLFSFRGFFPRKESERKDEVQEILEVCARGRIRVNVWFESPQRIVEALEALHGGLGGFETRVCVAKELTKTFETVFIGSSEEVLVKVREHVSCEGEKGEWCFAVLLPPVETLKSSVEQSSDWVKALQCMLEYPGENPPIAASEAARRVSQYFGVAKKIVYEKALQISGKKI